MDQADSGGPRRGLLVRSQDGRDNNQCYGQESCNQMPCFHGAPRYFRQASKSVLSNSSPLVKHVTYQSLLTVQVLNLMGCLDLHRPAGWPKLGRTIFAGGFRAEVVVFSQVSLVKNGGSW